ncbi:MAG: M14 family zinc carboxypeptidase, partial [Sphingobacterium sp.]
MNSETISAQQIPYELDPNKNTTVTYPELINFYEKLVKGRNDAKLIEIVQSDIGKPLHLLILSKDGDFEPKRIKEKGKAVLFMNNGIHPGEPEGMDASIMLVRDMLSQDKLPDNLVICLIPVYNIAGMLNRGVSRANQNGPEAYGFRGSQQHYDLNRDFIKGDTKNSRVFQKTFSTWDPDIFFDTHTSNGADYQYVMTLIESQKDKLNPDLSRYMKEKFTKPLYQKMEAYGFPMVPYVDSKGETPESGLVSFLESPRYSTGYAALHNTIGYMPETHMWKTYQQRVESTYLLMQSLIEISALESKAIVHLRNQIKEDVARQEEFPVNWQLDTEKVDTILFKGYLAGHKKSEVSGADRLYYDRNKPFEKEIPYYGTYKPSVVIKKPRAYVIPQSYEKLIQLMQINGVQMEQLSKDTVMEVEMYYIDSYQTQKSPYEGHYPHNQ